MPRLNLVDAYGVGTAIANAPVLNFALDIMEIDGQPMAKRGKRSGSKLVYRCRACWQTVVVPAHRPRTRCDCGGDYESLLKPLLAAGRLARDLPPPRTLREYVLDQLRHVALDAPGAGRPRADY
jgi:nicotinate phosphoribosyltransferase